jgi:hypothetical protein
MYSYLKHYMEVCLNDASVALQPEKDPSLLFGSGGGFLF